MTQEYAKGITRKLYTIENEDTITHVLFTHQIYPTEEAKFVVHTIDKRSGLVQRKEMPFISAFLREWGIDIV